MTQYKAIAKLVAIVRTVVPLAAAAQAGRCQCGALIPWRRMGWASPVCADVNKHGKWVEDLESDARHVQRLEENAEAICGIIGPRGWSSR